jgi:hypothetical protein
MPKSTVECFHLVANLPMDFIIICGVLLIDKSLSRGRVMEIISMHLYARAIVNEPDRDTASLALTA